MRSRVYRLLPVAMIGALALSGCSGDDAGDGKPSGAKEAWLEGNKADAELDQVVYRLTRQCMEGKGFTIHPDMGMDGELWVFNPDDILSEYTTQLTLEEAQKNGFGADPRGPGPGGDPGASGEAESAEGPSGDPSGDPGLEQEYDDRFYTELTDEQRDAYYVAMDGVNKEKVYEEHYKKLQEKGGDLDKMEMAEEPDFPNHEKVTLPDGTTRQYPTQGCSAEVNAQVFTDGMGVYLEKEYYAMNKFSTLIWEDLREGPEFQALNEAWSSCMTGRGFDGMESPEEAQQKAYELYYGESESIEGDDGAVATTYPGEEMPTEEEMDKAKEKEIKLAVAYVECDQEAGHSTGTAELMKAALDTYLVDYETELFNWYEFTKAALGKAQGLLKE